MAEYIVNVPDEEAECFIARFGFENVMLFGYGLTGEIVRCRDCKHYKHNSFPRCDLYSITHEVHPDGFCSWGERNVVEP